MGPTVSVLIGFREDQSGDRLRNLLVCLASISRQTFSSYEVVVVECDTEPRNQSLLSKKCLYHFLYGEGEYNSAAVKNVAATFATGNVFWFLDGDVITPPSFLEQAMCDMDGYRAHVPFGSAVWLDSESTSGLIDSLADYYQSPEETLRKCVDKYAIVILPQRWVLTTMVTSSLFREMGGWAEELGTYGDDTEFYNRLTAFAQVSRRYQYIYHLYHHKDLSIKDVTARIALCNKLCRDFDKRRFDEGYLVLHIPEVVKGVQ